MGTATADAASSLTGRTQGVVSKEARSMARALYEAPTPVRRQVLQGLKPRELTHVLNETRREYGTPYGLWHDTPSGFAEDVIGETTWSLQRQVMDSIVVYKRTAVPAGFGVGKTFLAGRVVAWAGAVNPIGTMRIVTTATRMRQVRSQLWPHIKTAVAKAGLPGRTDTVQWVAEDSYGNDVQIAYGFSAAPTDEVAMQGIHGTPKLLLVVDEAGGISRLIGRGTNNLLTGDAAMLAIGNPPMSDPGSWFETLTLEGENPAEPTTTTIRIAAVDSPAITGEATPVCRACVPNMDGHTIAGGKPPHLPDKDWLERTLREYGDVEHPYIVAKVYARFPQDSGSKIIPASWVEMARQKPDPEGAEWVRPCELGLIGETDTFTVQRGAWVRLGIDVAAGGGDEFAVSRVIGDVAHIRHTSSGKGNADSNVVTEKALLEIQAAERLAAAIGSTAKVRVKIDVIGLGWGIYGNLVKAGQEGRHSAEVVAVNVAERPNQEDPQSSMKPSNKKAEMWLAGRSLLQPVATGTSRQEYEAEPRLRLRVETKTQAQLSSPNVGYTGTGLVVVESKAAMKARGVNSPDQAEALLLAVYEPSPPAQEKRFGLLN